MQIFITASTLKNTGTLLTVPIYCRFDLSLEVSEFYFRIFVIFCKHFVAVHQHFFFYCIEDVNIFFISPILPQLEIFRIELKIS